MPPSISVDAELSALLEHGAACVKVARRGKVPLGVGWHTAATQSPDEIAAWLDCGYNVGLLLGHGQLIDVEFDDAAGRRAVRALGLLDAKTPTYASRRGEHRIFRLADCLPDCAWRKCDSVEIRFGGRPAQSVLPPSQHPDGGVYRWIVSPCDYAPAVVTLSDLGVGVL